jgi:hypothetical protein
MFKALLGSIFRRTRESTPDDDRSDGEGGRSARIFVSSTFLDMQAERERLARAVFPRLRERVAGSGVFLFEVDLRWGITAEQSENIGTVSICLSEIDDCRPFFFCMLGDRYGWRPEGLRDLEGVAPSLLRDGNDRPSVTELEIRYGAFSDVAHGQPIFLFRTSRLSKELRHEPGDPAAQAELKSEIMRRYPEAVRSYDTLDEFESIAEARLWRQLEAWSKTPPERRKAWPGISRPAQLRGIQAAIGKRRPCIVTGPEGAGISWLIGEWLKTTSVEEGARIRVDGREMAGVDPINELAGALARRASGGDTRFDGGDIDRERVFSALADGSGAASRPLSIAVDHIDEAAVSAHSLDLSWAPDRLAPRTALIIATRTPRLLDEAQRHRWPIIAIEAFSRDEVAQFCQAYLKWFAKTLTPAQLACILESPLSPRVGALILMLDELRRHGRFEDIDSRLDQIVGVEDRIALAEEVLAGLRKAMPDPVIVDRFVAALALSARGLQEAEISAALAESPDNPLSPLALATIRLGLGHSVVRRGPRIDLTNGPIRALAKRTPAVAGGDGMIQRLLAVAAKASPERRLEEIPHLLLAAGDMPGLAGFLSEPDNAYQLCEHHPIYARGLLGRIPEGLRGDIFAIWRGDAARVGEAAWDLGRVAAEFGDLTAARALWDIDEHHHGRRPARAVLEAMQGRDDRSDRLLAEIAEAGPSQWRGDDALAWTAAVAACTGIVNGRIAIDAAKEEAWIKAACRIAEAAGSAAAIAQASLLAGQHAVLRAQWRDALAAFDRAVAAARRSGHARRLCIALERSAAVSIELHRFRAAAAKAEEGLAIAQQAGELAIAAECYERIIDAARLRAEWSNAFEWARRYIESMAGDPGLQARALRCLDALNRPQP